MALKDIWKDKVDGIDDVLAGDINSIAQEAIRLEEDKVDKVDGKDLSSNDFTDAEKEKLKELSNYDDTELKLRDERLKYYGDPNTVPTNTSFFTFETDDENMIATIISADEELTKAVIPYKYIQDGKEYLVTAIGGLAFYGYVNLTSIIIPNSITHIGNASLRDCGCESITIPGSVKTIDEYALSKCRNLRNVVIENGVTKIGHGILLDCPKLETLSIASSVTDLKENTSSILNDFNDNGLTITLAKGSIVDKLLNPKGKVNGEKITFVYTNDVTKEYVDDKMKFSLYNATKELERFRQYDDISIEPSDESLFLFDTIPLVGNSEFDEKYKDSVYVGCANVYANPNITIAKDIIIPYEHIDAVGEVYIVNGIGPGAFDSSSKLSTIHSVVIPNTVKIIRDYAFRYCDLLRKIVIPPSVTIISENAFYGCSAGLVVECVEGSYADTYAKEHGFTTKYIKKLTIRDMNDKIGDIETALDSIIDIQNELIGGDSI